MYINIYIYVCIVVKTREFSENKVLNVANVELLQLMLHLLLHVVKHSVTTCGSKCNINHIYTNSQKIYV